MRKRSATSLNTVANRFDPATDYFHIPLHEASGADFSVHGRYNGTDFTETFTLAGSPADTVWTGTPGYFTNEGDNAVNMQASTEIQAIGSPANYSSGGILMLCGLYLTAGRTPDSSLSVIYQYGRASTSSPGGLILQVANAANANLQFILDNVGGQTVGQIAITATTDTFIPAWAWFDFGGSNGALGATGVYGDGTAADYGGTAGTLPDYDASFGIGFSSSNATGPVQTKILNAGTVDLKIHDFWNISFSTTPSDTVLTAIIKEFAQTPYEKLLEIP